MFSFVFSTILMLSIGMLLYLVARALPRVEEEPHGKPNILDRWAASEIPEKVDATFNAYLAKFLRKTKVVLLKVDNSLTARLKKMTPSENGGLTGKPKIDFKDITGAEEEKEE
jgi:hypothetical protein